MNYAVAALFLVTGLINLAPASGAFSAEQLAKFYGAGPATPDVILLLRHRAILFAIVGTLICLAAFVPSWRLGATAAGIVSMISFVVLVFRTANDNPNLVRIAWIDVAASVVLLAAYAMRLISAR